MAESQAAATTEQNANGTDNRYGSAEGPDAMYVKLISSDEHEFYVKREHALTSGTIKAMLSGPGEYFWLRATGAVKYLSAIPI